jgi:PD-(D/E)XK nuclease superfamily
MLADPGGFNELTRAIIGCGIQVHDFLGPGLFESVYRECMLHELNARGFAIEVERPISLVYRDGSLKSKFLSTSLSNAQSYWSSRRSSAWKRFTNGSS